MRYRHKAMVYLGGLLTLAAVAAFFVGIYYSSKHKIPTPQTKAPALKQQPAKSQSLAYVFVIVDENQPYGNIIGNTTAPYINSLANRYSLATNYSSLSHPSLPNYMELTSGSNDGVTTDCNPPGAGCEVSANNLADSVESSGRTWKAYAEGMPSSCYPYNSGNYATKHVPFLYYKDIVTNYSRCSAHVVPFTQLNADLSSVKTTPNFALITPNLCDDMHDCSVATGDSWLASNVSTILNSPAFTKSQALLVITWDEGNATDNHVATILAGSAVKPGYRSAQSYNTYSLLRTIESKWGLKPLTANDSQAPVMSEFFKSQ
ncbi:MAG: alkaline phosphatase family protein [Candidatus Saccharimonadales bacterium]